MTSYLHVGFPKCASSFLQKEYFIPQNGFINIMTDEKWAKFIQHQLLTAQSTYYDNSYPMLPKSKDNKQLIGCSYEGFTDGWHNVDYSLILERFSNIFPDAKILIIIRRQQDIVFSNYIQYVRAGYFKSIDNYLEELIWNSQQSIWGRLFYDKIYEKTCEIFEEVLIIPYELIKYDHGDFIKKLNLFFEKNAIVENRVINPSSNDFGLNLMRLANYFIRHGIGKPYMSVLPDYCVGGGRYNVVKLEKPEPSSLIRQLINVWATRIGNRKIWEKSINQRAKFKSKYLELFKNYFVESNLKLDRQLQLNLAKYGYVVE